MEWSMLLPSSSIGIVLFLIASSFELQFSYIVYKWKSYRVMFLMKTMKIFYCMICTILIYWEHMHFLGDFKTYVYPGGYNVYIHRKRIMIFLCA